MSETGKNYSSAFKEKKWGKEEEGEYITDGFSFRGKNAFRKPVEGFKEMLKKGEAGEINGVKFQVLDVKSFD